MSQLLQVCWHIVRLLWPVFGLLSVPEQDIKANITIAKIQFCFLILFIINSFSLYLIYICNPYNKYIKTDIFKNSSKTNSPICFLQNLKHKTKYRHTEYLFSMAE